VTKYCSYSLWCIVCVNVNVWTLVTSVTCVHYVAIHCLCLHAVGPVVRTYNHLCQLHWVVTSQHWCDQDSDLQDQDTCWIVTLRSLHHHYHHHHMIIYSVPVTHSGHRWSTKSSKCWWMLKAMLKKWVFESFLKLSELGTLWMWVGSAFHADGPACENTPHQTWSWAVEVDRLKMTKYVDQNVAAASYKPGIFQYIQSA